MDEHLVELRRETRSSIELSRGRSGEYAWTIKLYFDATPAATRSQEADWALAEISAIDSELASTYLGDRYPTRRSGGYKEAAGAVTAPPELRSEANLEANLEEIEVCFAELAREPGAPSGPAL